LISVIMGYSLNWLLDNREYPTIAITLIIGIGLRGLHLADGAHYHILGADSYHFHYLARQILNGSGPALEHSGLSYPVAWLGSFTSLYFASCCVPILLYIGGSLVIYYGSKYLFSPGVALGAVMSYTCIPLSVLTTAAGYLDRDGLTVIILTIIVIGWYKLRARPILALGCLVIMIEILTVYWSNTARWVVITIMIGLVMSVWVTEIYYKKRSPTGSSKDLLIRRQGVPVLIALGMSAGIGVLGSIQGIHNFHHLAAENLTGSNGIVEMSPATPAHFIIFYTYTIITGFIGAWVMVARRLTVDIMILTWLLGIMAGGLIAQRLLILTVPAMAIISGVGLAEICKVAASLMGGPEGKRIRAAAAALVFLVFLGIGWQSYRLGSVDRMAPGETWLEALGYLKDNTAEDAKVLTHWGYGYWIKDLAGRDPVAAGGPRYAEEVERICRAADPQEIYDIMAALGADYLVIEMDRVEGEGLWRSPALVSYGGIRILSIPSEQITNSAE